MTTCFFRIPKTVKSKKGQLGQIMFVISYITFVALAVILISFVVSKIMHEITSANPSIPEVASVETTMTMMPHYYDYTFIFLILALTAGLVISSFLIPSHPIFLVVNIFGIVLLVIFSMILSNLFGHVVTEPQFEDFANQFPYTLFVMQYLPWICVTITLISTVVMYAKSRASGGGYG
ncbi:MAG: hypothetical protein QXR60_04080 [Candidatus Nanoarchaeia archaeon]